MFGLVADNISMQFANKYFPELRSKPTIAISNPALFEVIKLKISVLDLKSQYFLQKKP